MVLHIVLVAVFSTLLALGAAAPSPRDEQVHNARRCSEISLRKEWRDMTVKHRHSYIDAVKCLQTLPPSVPGQGATSRFEEYLSAHIDLTSRIHLVGQFLPWHRNYIHLYAKELRDRCHYKGPIPFWDWARDGDNVNSTVAQSPIFDGESGFGGDGVPGTYTLPAGNLTTVNAPQAYRGCVMDGPFAASKFTLNLGPGTLRTKHCLVRGFNDTVKHAMTTDYLEEQLQLKTFAEFRLAIDNGPKLGMHIMTHVPTGGEMLNFWSAPGDPIFYLSHMNLDRLWWQWQQRNLRKRLTEIDGPTTQGGTDSVTLDFVLDFPNLGPNITIREVMDVRKEPNCFAFDY